MSIFEQRESNIRAYARTYPTVFVTAKNSRQVDDKGKEYIDFFAGAGVLNFGHNNDRMVQAMIDYMQKDGVLHSLDMQTQAKAEFMQKFSDVVLAPRNMPHRMQFMGPTGTNAVEAAMKLARKATGRYEIIAFGQGFHGMTLGALAATANEYFRQASGVPLLHVSHEPFEHPHDPEASLQALQQLADLYRDPSSGVKPPAAFMVETIQAEGGVNVASTEWMQALEKLAKDFGSILIVDDIQVGCGRTGSYFSFDGMGITPDIVTLAKGVGGVGTPMAMNLVHPDLDKHWSPGEHTGTFRGQNLSFIAGREALTYFEDDELMNGVGQKANVVRSVLAPLVEEGSVKKLRGRGLILGLDVGSGEVAAKVVQRCFQQGLMLGACGSGGRVLKIIPPLTIPESDLQEGLTILRDAVRFVMEEAA
ncbi:diaminobutyrate--2-oxoglutarate transaminase [Marinomonas piezotolerans]|uniref:Diaminobutyrate--2-oxoglutarate transaminase n=1 Tax=Marinomonas piezotolerans TaxID=2213058 RepID=A0A370U700_9GAMM|nr:aspartate aminotransferase family protein [Marinomonas piezotolerans]RDL43559.1 diaminobutyrate--2-oxoglutarate transaminase [Marinomonas piezotolerans]